MDLLAGLAAALVANDAVDQSEQCEVAPHADVLPRANPGSELADENVSGLGVLASVDLDAAALAVAVAAVARAALPFFCEP